MALAVVEPTVRYHPYSIEVLTKIHYLDLEQC